MWVPILICTWFFCSGEPIEGKPQPTYEECRQVVDLAVDLAGYPVEFTRRYVVKKCERRDR